MGRRLRNRTIALVLFTIFITVTLVLVVTMPLQEMLGEARWKWLGLYLVVIVGFLILGGNILYRRFKPVVAFFDAREKGEKPEEEILEKTRDFLLTYPAIGTLRISGFIFVGVFMLGALSIKYLEIDVNDFWYYIVVGLSSIVFVVTFVYFIIKRSMRPIIKALFEADPKVWKRGERIKIPVRLKLLMGFACMVAVMGLLVLVTNNYYFRFLHDNVSDPLQLEAIKSSIWRYALTALGVAAAVGLAIAWLLSEDFVWPLNIIVDAAEEISHGKRREGVPWLSEDEIGVMANAINRMTTDMLANLHAQVDRAEELVSSLEETLRTTMASADSISAISAKQAEGATEQSVSAQQASSASVQISATARRIAAHAQAVEKMSSRAREAGESGGYELKAAVRGINSVAERFKKVTAAVQNLGERSQEIMYILELMEEVSAQVNLLAMNAALEAAGAGKEGRRFGVVAQEVGRLAEKTSDAIMQINTIVEEIASATNQTLETAEEAGQAAFASADVAQGLEESFTKILDLVNSTNQLASEIEKATVQQTTACDLMVETIHGFADSASEVERDTQDLAGNVKELMEQADRLKKTTADSGN